VSEDLFACKTSWLNVFAHSCGMNARSCRVRFCVFALVRITISGF
jgi:hypothetical protein